MEKEDTQQTMQVRNNFSAPMAIVIAGALIAGAIYFVGARGDGVATAPQPKETADNTVELDNMSPITSADHIRGNQDALVTIVEYSDMECPFCARFHSTMQQVVDEYGKNGQVSWIYRHFPLDSIHSKARTEAVATECAAELGGNDAFWKYLDRFLELTPSNNQTDINTVLPQIAREIGIDEARFTACVESDKYEKRVEDDYQNAIATGGNGTPWSIIVTKSGKKYPLSGAQPYASVKQLIEIGLRDK
ncbi:MAG: thioredoxin domain-containing protein [Patescibacteria group bacterium]